MNIQLYISSQKPLVADLKFNMNSQSAATAQWEVPRFHDEKCRF